MSAPAEPCTCNALRRAERHVARHYEHALAPFHLTVDQFSALAKLARLGPAAIPVLAERLVMDRAMLNYVLKGLVPRDLVAVSRDAGDGRRRTVALTPAGAALFAEARARWSVVNDQIDAALGTEAPALRDLLKAVETLDLRLDAPPPRAVPAGFAGASALA